MRIAKLSMTLKKKNRNYLGGFAAHLSIVAL